LGIWGLGIGDWGLGIGDWGLGNNKYFCVIFFFVLLAGLVAEDYRLSSPSFGVVNPKFIYMILNFNI